MDIQAARLAFAQELRYVAHVRSDRVVAAFATVPRERFLGDRPWQVADLAEGYWEAPADDPAAAYHNVLFAIDASRQLNNGQPEFWARLLDKVEIRAGERVFHIGAGAGYYTAILAELTQPTGSVIAVEIEPELAERARSNLASHTHVEVVAADGANFDPGMVDVIVVNAGVTHPPKLWLEALMTGGRMLLPVTAEGGRGTVFLIERLPEPGHYAAKAISGVQIYSCAGVRDDRAAQSLARALGGGGQRFVRSLRRDPHERDGSCWLHGTDFCFSVLP